ncbi:MAG TPA: PD-(D/E)XK nuclease family protein [Terriglobia bacterium]|nr:PD-(D/E)XK nuclease family protein [Terriglobia bacterium]
MIQVFVSSCNEDRLAAAQRFVSSFAPATEALLIGASREAVDELVYELSRSAHATFGLYRFSLTQLAARLSTAEFARTGLAHSTPLGAEAVAARATFDALERGALRYFGPVARHPGFARALARTLQALRLAGIEPARLTALADPGPDLDALLAAFEQRLAEARLADRAALLAAACRALPGEPRYHRGERVMPLLLLDIPIETPAERDFVAALAGRSQRVLATVPDGDEATLAAWARVDGVSMTGMAGMASRASMESPPEAGGTGLARLRRYLFTETPPPEAEAGDEVRFFSAPGEGRECVEIARRILEEARNGVRFDRMAVLLRDPGAYSGFLETAFGRAGIPAYFARGTRRPDPAGRAFLALLACAAEKLSARRFAEYLSLGQVPALDATGGPPPAGDVWAPSRDEALGPAAEAEAPAEAPEALDETKDPESSGAGVSADSPAIEGSLRAPWKWEQFLVEAAVIGGQDRWARRLAGLEAEWRLRLGDLQREEQGSARAQAFERKLENLGHLRRFALPVVEALAGLPGEATWGEWLAALEQLAPRVLSRPARVVAVLAEFKPMAEVGPVGVNEVYDVLAPRLSTLEPEPPARPYGRVFAGTLEQARGRAFEVVFVPGVAERIFPQRPREDPLLLDALRKRLADGGAPGLDRQDDRLKRERLLLRLAAGAATQRIHFSYPRLELSKARQRVPSFYALDVRQASTGRIPRLEDLQREAESESASSLAWPAPSSAADSIDDMEHDLATLRPLLSGHALGERMGRARYLLELNEHLARSLRARRARWGTAWSVPDGLCESGDAARGVLAKHRLRARPYSVSALQKFAVCPYQFLLYGVHKLEPREDAVPLVQIDPLTRGTIFHHVLADFMRRLQSEGRLPVTLENLPVDLEVLEQALQQAERKYRDELAPAIPQVWREGIDSIRTDLRGWLQRTADEPSAWVPAHFEFGIGFGPQDGHDRESRREPTALAGGYLLHGIVDLVERHECAAEWRVTDYKTGSNRTRDGMLVAGGEVLQPVLYGLAVEAALGERVSEGRLYFCTAAGGFSERAVRLHDVARQRGLQVLETVDRALERAFLPPAPKEGACKWCDFRDVCGPLEELRVAQKDQEKLDDLQTLRCLP